jgi:hypothetical protein
LELVFSPKESRQGCSFINSPTDTPKSAPFIIAILDMDHPNLAASKINIAIDKLRTIVNGAHKHRVLNLANLINELYQSSDWPQIHTEIFNQHLLSIGQISLLIGISRNKTLISNAYQEFLPNSYNILYQLSFLNQKQLDKFIESGAINPTMNLAAAKKIKNNA